VKNHGTKHRRASRARRRRLRTIGARGSFALPGVSVYYELYLSLPAGAPFFPAYQQFALAGRRYGIFLLLPPAGRAGAPCDGGCLPFHSRLCGVGRPHLASIAQPAALFLRCRNTARCCHLPPFLLSGMPDAALLRLAARCLPLNNLYGTCAPDFCARPLPWATAFSHDAALVPACTPSRAAKQRHSLTCRAQPYHSCARRFSDKRACELHRANSSALHTKHSPPSLLRISARLPSPATTLPGLAFLVVRGCAELFSQTQQVARCAHRCALRRIARRQPRHRHSWRCYISHHG